MNNIPEQIRNANFSEYLALGWSLFPLPYRKKKPTVGWKKYQSCFPTPEECSKWDDGKYNIAIVTGKLSGIFVVDIDGPKGEATLQKLEEENSQLPVTATVKTGNGRHMYFVYPADLQGEIKNLAGKSVHGEVLDKFDVRGEGGFVVAPPSIHPSGNSYIWKQSPWEVSIAEAPEWLLDLVVHQPPIKREPVLDFSGNTGSKDAYVQAAFEDEIRKLSCASKGSRNSQLNSSTFSLAQLFHFGLNEQIAIAKLRSVALDIGLDVEEIDGTIKSAVNAGKATPRYINKSCSKSSDCSSSNWPEIIPLESDLDAPELYPVYSLPPIVQDAILSYQEYGQQPLPIIAIAALSNMSLACQGLANVARDAILTGPISLSFIVTAESGERKTSADKVFSAAIREWEKNMMEEKQGESKQFKSAYDVYEAKRKGLLQEIAYAQKSGHKGKKPDADQASQQIQELDKNKPEPPILPILLLEDITQEALVEQLANGWPSAALYSDEAAIVIGSHSLHPERCLRYFGFLNRMWDGNSYKRQRITTEDCYIYGKRLTCSLMMQISVLKALINVADGQSRNTGFLARILLACPESTMGTRFYKEPNGADKNIAAFNRRIQELFTIELPLENGEIKPETLKLSHGAMELWVAYYDKTEKELGKCGSFENIKDFAAKSAENAARLAANFHVFNNGPNGIIDAHTMEDAIKVAYWHLCETKRILGFIDIPEENADAKLLLDWLLENNKNSFSARDISQVGPNSIRNKVKRDKALNVLCDHGYLVKKQENKREIYNVNPNAYEKNNK